MQAFIREEDVVRYEELLAWNLLPDREVEYELFYVEVTDTDRYRAAVDSVASIRRYNLTRLDETAVYVYVCQETREADVAFRRAFADLDLVVVPPVVYDTEAAMRFTIVGEGPHLRQLLEDVPDDIDVTVEGVGEYDRRHGTLAADVTDRQQEAVAAAAAVGYYDVPRTGSLADVAAELGCAESTASNLLRRAEAGVMRRLVAHDRERPAGSTTGGSPTADASSGR
jgi:predicted DNA binding protein